MDVRAVIYDRDGVLTDFNYAAATDFFEPLLPLSLDTIFARWEAWGAVIGFPRTIVEEKRFFRGFWDGIADDLDLHADVRQQLHDFDYTTCMDAFPEVRDALLLAKDCNLRVGVLSNFSLASLEESLIATDLDDLIDVALSATQIGYSKPDAQSYTRIADALGVASTQCLFFDDEVPCVHGACGVGMRGFWVDRSRNQHLLSQGIVRDLTIDLKNLI